MSGYINTIKDLEAATYGYAGPHGNSVLKAAGVVGGFGTPHDVTSNPFSGATGLGDLYNVLYGQKVWSMLNQEVNALSMLAKRPYTASGWRVLKSRPQGGSSSAFAIGAGATGSAAPAADKIGGVGENAALGTDIPAIAPEYEKLYISPKTVAHLFEFSELGMELAAIDDGVGDIRAIVREDMGKHHAETQQSMLLMPLQRYSDANAANIERNYTSLMKIVSSAAEIAAMYTANLLANSASDGNGTQVDTEVKRLFGTERTVAVASNSVTPDPTASFLDAEVDYGAGYASGNARVLTLSLLNDMIRRIRQNGGNPKVILTGYDTVQKIADLLQSQERFMDRKEIVPTHNGVRGVKGQEVGFRVATYYDIPIIPTKDMPATNGMASQATAMSDLLILDTDHLWLSVMKPTQYFEDGITSGNPFGVGKLGNQGMYRTMGETGCSFFKAQGKITNLKTA